MLLSRAMTTIPHLTDAEAETRRAAGQGNPPPPPSGRSYWRIVRENVFTFVNNIIMTNVVVSVVQEIRAKRMLDQIALLTRPTATVLRDTGERAVPPEELVI